MKFSKLSVAAAFVFMTSAVFAGVNTANSASAWKVGHHASAFCNDDAKISFNWSFQNKEPNDTKWDIDLTVKESNSGSTDGPHTVKATKSATGMIDTDLTSVGNGKVVFEMTWTDGRSGVDSRSASYDALECQEDDKEIKVCRDGKEITIKKSQKKKTDTDTCPTPPNNPEKPKPEPKPEEPKPEPKPEVKQVEICRDGKQMTVSEDEVKDSDIEGDCPQTLGTSTSLPKTGATEFVAAILGAGTLVSAAYGHYQGKRR